MELTASSVAIFFIGFAIGALAFDFTAFFVAPLFGIEMQGIEYETPQSPYQPPTRNPLPPHPYNQRRHGR